MSLRKLGGETLIYGLSSVLGRLLTFVIVTPVLTRLLSREEYGVVSDLMMWTGLLIALLVFRMDTALFRFASRAEFAGASVFKKTQWFVVASVGVGVVLYAGFEEAIAGWMKYPDRTVYLRLVVAAVAFDALSAIPLARLRLRERSWAFVAVNLGNVAVNIALLFLLLFTLPGNERWFTETIGLTYDPNYQVGYYLAAIALASALRYLALLVDGWWYPEPVPDRHAGSPSLKTLLVYSAPLTLVAVAGIYNALSGPTLLKELADQGSTTENLNYAGLFGASIKLAVILNLFVTAYNYAAEPFFFRQAGRDLATADRTIYADASRAYALVAATASVAILLLLPWLRHFIDADYFAGLVILPVLLGGNFLFGLYANFAIAYKLTDRTWMGGLIALSGSVVLYLVSNRFAPAYTIWAPAWGMLACYGLMCILAYVVSRRYFPVDYPLGRIFLYALLAAGTVWVGQYSEVLFFRVVLLLAYLLVVGLLEQKWVRRVFLTK